MSAVFLFSFPRSRDTEVKISFKSQRHKHHHTVRAVLVPVLSPLFVCQLFVLQRPRCFINQERQDLRATTCLPATTIHPPHTHTPASCVPACLTTGSGGSRHTHTHTAAVKAAAAALKIRVFLFPIWMLMEVTLTCLLSHAKPSPPTHVYTLAGKHRRAGTMGVTERAHMSTGAIVPNPQALLCTLTIRTCCSEGGLLTEFTD